MAFHQPDIAGEVGGVPAFRALVDDFYARVETDPPLRRLYPDDLGPGKEALALFLAQYFGAGNVYSATRGHPRLRMRHAPFRITHDGATRWATHMAAAVREQGWPDEAVEAVLGYVAMAAPTMINTVEQVQPSARGELPVRQAREPDLPPLEDG